jgi:hypothetical protein
MLDVGGQAPVMDPAEVARRQKLAQVLMQNGQDPGNMRHWSQALGAVLNSGAGIYQGKQAAQGLAQGQQSGNADLAQLLMGGDASAAMSNPYSAEKAQAYQMKQNDPVRQLQMEKLKRELAQPVGSDQPASVKEWEYFNKLNPEQQNKYMDMKRQQNMLNAGTQFVDPTGRRAPVAIDNAGKKAQTVIGAGQGAATVAYPMVKQSGDLDVAGATLATRPENRAGSDEFWDRAEGMLAEAARLAGVTPVIALKTLWKCQGLRPAARASLASTGGVSAGTCSGFTGRVSS